MPLPIPPCRELTMNLQSLEIAVPEELLADFASDPLSPWDGVLHRSNDTSWPLHGALSSFLRGLPQSAVDSSYSDKVFLSLYGRSEELARIWFTQQLLIDEVSRRRLTHIAGSHERAAMLPYSTAALDEIRIDDEQMVKLSDLEYTGTSLNRNTHSFVTCLINQSFNSTFWLQEAFYKQRVSNDVSVRLDPYLWGRSDRFPAMIYRMLVYAKPMNWERIANLRDPEHGQMRPESSSDRTEVTEFCWTPRDDGIHFVCEELPRRDLVDVQASRYLHAIYDPSKGKITHFDGALRIYTEEQIGARLCLHVRNAGKVGIRKKVFRTDAAIDRDAFSLIVQAFFIWNRDIVKYFAEALSSTQRN
jgi:hypothetical protein